MLSEVARLKMKVMKLLDLSAYLSRILNGKSDCNHRLLWQLLACLSLPLLKNVHLEILGTLATLLAELLQGLIASHQSMLLWVLRALFLEAVA